MAGTPFFKFFLGGSAALYYYSSNFFAPREDFWGT
jgi:hypothetical protein